MQFERPIPGQSLTTPPKSAPFERPPEIADPVKALDYHLVLVELSRQEEQELLFL